MRLLKKWQGGCSVVAAFVAVATMTAAAVDAQSVASPAPAASAPADASAPAATMTVLQGTVRSGTGLPVSGAAVKVTGPSSATTTTDASGAFTLTVPQGIYTIEVHRGGYNPAVLTNVVAVGGTSLPVSVTMNPQDLSSLRTIGNVSSASRGSVSSINTGAANSSFVSGQTFAAVANPQINSVLQRIPDVTLQHMGSQPDVSIVLGGVQPYETQVLIDGHPLALGQYGVWTSQYFPSYLIGGVETQSGPGNTTPFANIAVGGTVNLLTPGFTTKPTAEISYGGDNYSSQFSNFLATGSVSKLQYVVGAGVSGINGPYYQTNKCVVQSSASGANENVGPNVGVVQYCGDASGSFFSKGEVGKLRYNFSSATSLDLGFTGAWGGYSPQGTAWGTYLGSTKIVQCLPDAPGHCTNPANANLVGQNINAYQWYLGSSIYNNQDLFDAQFRTTLGNNTVLVRPYLGDIEPEITTGGESQAATPELFSPVGANPYPTGVTAINATPTQTINNNNYLAWQTSCGNAFGNQTNPAGNTVTVNGQKECFGSAFITFEQDKLYGSTFSFIHPFGDNFLDFSYDFHGESTFAVVACGTCVSVPDGTADRFSTFSVTADLEPIKNVSAKLGLYDTQWTVNGFKLADPTDTTSTALTGLDKSVSRFDPHFALTFHPTSSVSYRAAVGSSATFPFVGQVSGLATYQPPAQSLGPPFQNGGTLTEKNPNLLPEVNIAYGLGADKRFGTASVVSVDLQQSVIHNVFETLTTSVPLNGGLEGIFFPVNAARLQTSLATLRYAYAPRVGFGFTGSVAANRSILSGVPLPVSGTQVPANGVQICGNGVAAPGIATCIPYLKGYGQLTYAARGGAFVGLGVEYEGKNNSYFQPPFALVDLTFRKPVTKDVEMIVGVENMLNTNVFSNASYLASPNSGTPLVADSSTGQQTTFTPTLIPAIPRTVRVQVRIHTGR